MPFMFNSALLAELQQDEPQQVLLVDDRTENLVAMEAILQDCGARLLRATSGESALNLLLDQEIALVLLDVQMPGMDGYEVMRLMRGNRRTQQIPTIFVTAYSRDERAVHNGYLAGAIDYLLKPVSATLLCNKVRQFLELDQYKRKLLRANTQLLQQKAYYESILNAAAEGVLAISPEGQVEFANPTAQLLLASTSASLIGLPFTRFSQPVSRVPPEWRQSVFYRYWKDRRELRLRDTLLHRQDGTSLPVALSCAPLAGDNAGSVIVFQDIRYHKKLEQQLRHQAVTDHLTGLSNRHGFKEALQSCVLRAERNDRHLALFFIDLDHFKDINDSLGHDSGDLILCTVAARLKEVVRAKDSVARLGGDEFTVIIDDLEQGEHAALIAEKMLLTLCAPYALSEQKVFLGASIGIALYPDNCSACDQLILAADLAMYRAKNGGRNAFEFFTPELNVRAKARLVLEQGLRRGLERQEFSLYYQAQYDLEGQRLIGAEALIRWQRNADEMVPPSEFVPLLEQTGLIMAVGAWVIQDAARQRRLWREQGVMADDAPIAINLSPRQFESEALLPTLKAAIAENRLLPSMLAIELTEGVLMRNSSATHNTLEELHQLGVRLSIDDFGTGYSSLAYLMQFDIDELKIDKSFIDLLDCSARDVAITASIIQLAHNLQLQVVAEGVETQSQLEILRQLECDFIQGYLYARPVPAREFAAAAQHPRGPV
jgi:diguanylate cyclase (GGDEF)-like protein/PAS domain S-box-containing protein